MFLEVSLDFSDIPSRKIFGFQKQIYVTSEGAYYSHVLRGLAHENLKLKIKNPLPKSMTGF